MDVLNGSTLESAFRLCDKQPGMKIGIACASIQTANAFIESLWEEVRSGRMTGWEMGRDAAACGGMAILRRRHHVVRTHVEPSYIEIFTPHSVAGIDGKSFHKVLYESRLNEELVQRLGWTERLPTPGEWEDESSEELDEFLNSFKII